MHLLAIDIGNTAISFGLIKQGRIHKTFNLIEVSVSKKRLKLEVDKLLQSITRQNIKPTRCFICSVVPSITPFVWAAVNRRLKIKPKIIGKDVLVPIKNKYRDPKQVGQDRLVGAYAAKIIYGTPAIIIDFGTAITFDLINWRGEYEGGIIIPGIRLSAESLFHKTALLPRVENIKIPKELIGKDTQQSILSGLFNGYGAMCCGLIDWISRSIKGKPKVIVTGGYTDLMKKFLIHKIDSIDKHLIFKGIYLIAKLS